MTIPAASVGVQTDAPFIAPGYAIAPNAVVRDDRLSLTARLLYVLLDGRRADKAKGIRVSVATLAADLGCADATVRRAASELETAGWLARRRTGRTSSWRLDNPIRTGPRMAALQRTLDAEAEGGTRGTHSPRLIAHQRAESLTDSQGGTVEDSTPPQPALDLPQPALDEGREGRDRGDQGARSLTGDGSDRSLVSGLQSITREKYNNTADRVPAPASGGHGGDASQRGPGHETSDQQPSSSTRASAGTGQPAQTAGPTGQPVSDRKTAKAGAAPAPGDIAAVYLAEINAATGAKLVPNRLTRELMRKIAAKGIPAPEAALTAAAWLAVKGDAVASPEGFLAAIALPSMANGQELDTSPPKPTPTPPAYRELVAQELCDHGAEMGRCALCRRTATSPPPAPAAPRDPGAWSRSQRENALRAQERSWKENPPPWIVQAEERRQPPPWAVAPDAEELSRCQHGQRLGTPCHACDPSLSPSAAPTASDHLSAALAKLGAPR